MYVNGGLDRRGNNRGFESFALYRKNGSRITGPDWRQLNPQTRLAAPRARLIARQKQTAQGTLRLGGPFSFVGPRPALPRPAPPRSVSPQDGLQPVLALADI